MGRKDSGPMTRSECDLVSYFRGLSVEMQLELLERAEGCFNAARRMEELAGRVVEQGGPEPVF